MNNTPMPTASAAPPARFLSDVLIVEDDAAQCEEMGDFLARAGLKVHLAFDAEAGLRQAYTHRPRVALLDFNLPDIDGTRLAHGLRTLIPDLAILMMSGRIDGLSERTLNELGIKAFVNKPVPLVPLRQAVLRLARPQPGSDSPAKRPNQPRASGWLSTGLGGTRY